MRSEAQYLWDIIDAADATAEFIAGASYEQFQANRMIRAAVHAQLMIIGEAVCHLSEALMERYPEVPWRDIRGFRNAVVHGYFKVDWDIMWRAATVNAPALSRAVNEILDNDFPSFRPESL